jgi:hypothetical protein
MTRHQSFFDGKAYLVLPSVFDGFHGKDKMSIFFFTEVGA